MKLSPSIGFVLLLGVGAASGSAAAEADLVLRGGVVYTVDPQRTRAQAVAVDGGRIVAVGSNDDVAPSIGGRTEVVELAGAMVLPGFHDAHAHLISGGMDALACSLIEARTVEAILAKVRECAGGGGGSAGGDDGDAEWLIGAGWDLSLFSAANPHRRLLDGVVPDRPVLLDGADGHSAWANSKALALAGIDRATPDPPGGVIERDAATGEPSGTLRETAMSLVRALVPPPSEEAHWEGLRYALRSAASFGITSILDPSVSDSFLAAYDQAAAASELTARVMACARPVWRDNGRMRRDPGVQVLLDPAARPASSRIRTGCAKIFVDGVLEGETAALLEPYLGRGSHRGTLHVEPKALARALTHLDAHGVQVHLHTIGDRAVRVALDAIAAAQRANGTRGNRHHLAHLQLVDPMDVARFAALDVTATFQALWAYPDSYVRDNVAQIGPERVARMYPVGSMHRAGGRIAGGSDWPVTSINPLLAIEVALTRQDPAGRADQPARPPEGAPAIAGSDAGVLNASERVDLDTMLAAYTIQGAWLMRHESTTGSIEVGKAADLVVLERDLFAIAPAEIGEVRVLRTLIEGDTVYRAAD